MFELLLTVCVGISRCDYLAPPLSYATETSCRHQAALIAGTIAGKGAPGSPVVVRFRCQETGSAPAAAEWIEVRLSEELR